MYRFDIVSSMNRTRENLKAMRALSPVEQSVCSLFSLQQAWITLSPPKNFNFFIYYRIKHDLLTVSSECLKTHQQDPDTTYLTYSYI